MRILVIGSGAREHAIIARLLEEAEEHEIICAPGNAGIAAVADTVSLDSTNGAVVADFAVDNNVQLVVIGPEAPLVAGVADAVRRRGIPVFGPAKSAARLEGSKTFAKQIMDAANVPTARSVHAGTLQDAEAALDALGAPYVVKADGLAAGKGVLVTSDRDAALAHAEFWLGHGGVLMEEFLEGPEVSLFFLSDGDTVRALTPAQDFKRLLDNDEGPNTGGMGAYSPLPWLPDGFVQEVTERVAEPVIRQLELEGSPYIGLLYCGLVITPSGVKVIEFNARFGDPETQVVLPRLVSPLSALLFATANGSLENLPAPEFSDEACVTVVLASEGYPDAAVTGRTITGLAEAEAVEGVHLAHAATARTDDGAVVAMGGRVLSVVARGADLAEARERAYRALGELELEGGQFRTDIALKAAE
ncbi:MAG TPA: phosphoribosylamine--glycine ligase [Terrimesophilobacter sp.]|nr:phosphoribosylamine--glycine ligase [Terrimesophilobacter sp.]